MEVDKEYNCSICGKTFAKDLYLNRHMNTCHINSSKKFVCSVCLKEFAQKRYLYSHLQLHSEKSISEHCKEEFGNTTSLKSHVCNKQDCAKSSTGKTEAKTHMEVDKKYNCSICGKTFANNLNLNKHLKTCHNNSSKKLVCSICLQEFAQKKDLCTHLKRHSEKSICENCNKEFGNTASLKSHVCNKQDYAKSSTSKTEAKTHMEVDKKYNCSICGKTFTSNHNLYRHLKTCHSNSSEKFVCSICLKKFTQKRYLGAHLKRHSSEKSICEHYNKEFGNTASLKSHVSITQDCAKSSTSKTEAKTHMNSKLKKCPICDFSGLKLIMINHYRTEHNITVSQEEINFQNMEEFFYWKQKLETSEMCSFTTKGTHFSKEGDTFRKIYQCHRNGYYNPRGSNKRRLKTIGTNKINGFCPAELKVKNSKSGVIVQFTKTHVGHLCEVARQRLPKSAKDLLAQKISMKIPFKSILNEIRGLTSRTHLLTKKDLYNLKAAYKLNKEDERTKKDVLIVEESWIYDMEGDTDSVQFYELPGEVLEKYPEQDKEDFISVNDAQSAKLTVCENIANETTACLIDNLNENEHNDKIFKSKLINDFIDIVNDADVDEDTSLIAKHLKKLAAAMKANKTRRK